MAKRGRKSEAELSVVPGKFGEAKGPPDDLSARQVEIWNQIVLTEPSGHFETEAQRGLLSDYCRHRESAETVSGVIDTFKQEWLKSEDGARRYNVLLKMRDQETKATMRCATKLRITNQSRYTPQAAGTASRNNSTLPNPWDEE